MKVHGTLKMLQEVKETHKQAQFNIKKRWSPNYVTITRFVPHYRLRNRCKDRKNYDVCAGNSALTVPSQMRLYTFHRHLLKFYKLCQKLLV
jgi:hypothetical protein